jgi:DNA polymerase-1
MRTRVRERYQAEDFKMIIAVDTETSGLHPDPPENGRVCVVSAAWRERPITEIGDGTVRIRVPTEASHRRLRSRAWCFGQGGESVGESVWFSVLDRFERKWYDAKGQPERNELVMHNAKFDLMMLAAGAEGDDITGYMKGRDLSDRVIWDTMVAERILEPLSSVGLEESFGRMSQENSLPDWKSQFKAWLKQNRLRASDMWRVPFGDIEQYATLDAEATLLLYEFQQRRLAEEDASLMGICEREMELMKVLFKMEQRGIGFDQEASLQAVETLSLAETDLELNLPWMRRGEYQKSTPNYAKKWFFEELGVPPVKTTAVRGDPTLDEEVVERLVKGRVEGAETWQQLQRIRSAKSKWYAAWPQKMGSDGRLRTVFKQTRVVTGRLAVERVQLQAIPHEHQLPPGVPTVRDLLRPSDNSTLWDLDLKNAEVRVAASIAQCVGMLEILATGRDVHGETAKKVWGINEDSKDFSRLRDVAKRLNFGIIYGAGARTIADQVRLYTGVEVRESQAREWVDLYRRQFPEFYSTARRAEKRAIKWGNIGLAGGRRRWFDKTFHEERKAFNAAIQGGVAEVMKLWMLEVEKKWPGILLLQIHDSLVLEIPDEMDEDGTKSLTAWSAAQEGSRLFQTYFPGPTFPVDFLRWDQKT